MKALLCKTGTLLLLLVFTLGNVQAKEVKKTLKKEFKTTSSTVLNLETKFSELKIEAWNQNLASFNVTIVAEHKDDDKAAKILDLMTVKFEQDGNEINVSTEIDSKFKKGDWGDSKKLKFILEVKIPADLEIDLENNFGSVVISKLTGDVSVENNYGSFVAQALTGENTSLELNYGDVRIGTLNRATIELNYGNLDVEEVNSLDVEVNFGNCKILEAKDVTAEVNMGDLKIEKVNADFSFLDLEASTGNIELGIDKSAGFTLDAEMSMGKIKTPSLDDEVSRKNGMSQTVKGTYGNGRSKITAEGNMGSIIITLR